MNRKLSFALAFTMAAGLVACDDDSSSTPTTPTEDVTTDTGADTHEDTTPGEDVAPDTTPDPECEEGQILIDGECVDAAKCGEDEFVKNNACRPVIASPADYPFSGTYSYINGIAIPDDNDECCFDLTGDGDVDNRLGPILDLVGGFVDDLDIGEILQDALIDDSFGLLLEYRGLDGLTAGDDFGISVFLVSDAGGEGEDSWADRNAGNGVFVIDPVSFDSVPGGFAGSQIEFNIASITDGTLRAGPSTFLLKIDVGSFSDDLNLGEIDLNIAMARIEAALAAHANGIATATDGAGKLGGAVPVEEVLANVNRLGADCPCTGLGDDDDILQTEIVDGEIDIFCNPAADIPACDGSVEGLVCGFLGQACGFVGLIATFLDVDTTGDDVTNALSLGLRLTMTGAELADPPIAD